MKMICNFASKSFRPLSIQDINQHIIVKPIKCFASLRNRSEYNVRNVYKYLVNYNVTHRKNPLDIDDIF